ncbi:MAG TPA: M28 family metallopeptidase [Pyrinomonadaceae bacterium]|jgi:Zn-dependent M28 family amino/carboxypeptidase
MKIKHLYRKGVAALCVFVLLFAAAPVGAKSPGTRPKTNAAQDKTTTGGEAARWWSHVQFLADDKLEGRDTGSEGHRKAVEYVIEQFKLAGLKPAGTNGYLQPVRFRARRIREEESSLALVRDGKTEQLKLGEDATFSMRIEAPETVEAPMVFAGYALSIPEANYDDFRGLDVRGKVVVYLSGTPSGLPAPLLAHYQSTAERWAVLKRLGAIGAINIPNPKRTDIPWERSTLARLQPSMSLADATLDDTAGQKLSVTVNAARAEKLFAGTDRTFKEILTLADAEKPLPTFPLPASVRASVRFETTEIESPNVVGVLPGNGSLKNEYVVLSAHLDHIGVGQPIKGDPINNGAMDNASGIATLIEVARGLRESKKKLRRSVVFLAVTAEEKGLLGSKYFAARPSVKASGIVANLNMDMFLPLFPLRVLTVYGLDESDLGADVRAVGSALGLAVQADPEPERNSFIRSDQYSFIRRGVPALAMKVGFLKGSPEAALSARWRSERYHAPSDDLQQPFDLSAAAGFNRVLLALTERVANRAERPRWNESSFFRRFAAPTTTTAKR